jgi:hypothetical protein
LKKKLFSEAEKIIITNLHFTKVIRIIRFMVIYLTLIMFKAKKVRKENPEIVEGSDESECE